MRSPSRRHDRAGQIFGQRLADRDRPGPGTAAAVWPAKGFVRIEVHHVGAEIAGPGDAQDGVHVRPVQIDQPAGVVHPPGDRGDLPIEHSQRVGIGDHEHRGLIVQLAGQIVHVDESLGRAFDGHKIKARHAGAGRIRAVRAVGGQHLGPLHSPVAKIGRRHQQRRQFALGTGCRLQRNRRQTGNLGQDFLQFEQ